MFLCATGSKSNTSSACLGFSISSLMSRGAHSNGSAGLARCAKLVPACAIKGLDARNRRNWRRQALNTRGDAIWSSPEPHEQLGLPALLPAKATAMIPPKDQLTICFAHAAYQMKACFDSLNTGIANFELRDR